MTPRYSLALSGERLSRPLPEPLSGIGLIRGEYVFRRGKAYVTTEEGRASLASYLVVLATHYPHEPIWYRTSELDVEEIKVLKGCDDDEINDRILIMGTRGIRRAIHRPEAFRLEIETLAGVAGDVPNLGIILPFVADPSEASWGLQQVRAAGFKGPMAIMGEIPATVVALHHYLDLGFRRVVIGLNDLTAFTMGAYRGSGRYPGLPLGVERMIEIARGASAAFGVELAMAGAITPDHLSAAGRLGIDECVIHYADLPTLLGEQYRDLPELDQVARIKRWTRRAIHERRRRLGISPIDPYGN